MPKLEVCCFNPESARIAANAGAHRIELCNNREAGGVTPPTDWLTQIKLEHSGTPVFVMIRPRDGDFVYTEDEFDIMRSSITSLKEHADGFVFGVLNPDRTIDIARTTELVCLAEPLPCTFHKAFDETPGQFKALEDIISTGCLSILTSGGAKTASQGISALRMLAEKVKGRVEIIVAGGVRLDNLAHIRDMSRARWFHSSALDADCGVPNAANIKQMLEMLDWTGAQTKQSADSPFQ
ncbi:hypothetical protein DOTSEDRAFT_71355 [Dothistroma septosporum NZE10]|uniref:Copper homeostasis protein cutC homolog n=1 Tax=Dothistroma septosporum (strain NZE10 / CBS 128990) TaxID=675120 RepID=N1PTF3_DOTSN|nr:hypothetical protein DOTSEDRAFT_71355 [Dothistroma septosporum NZE10]